MHARTHTLLLYHVQVHILKCSKLSTGGILAGLVSDLLQARAFTSTASLYMAIPAVSVKRVGLITRTILGVMLQYYK